MNAIEKRAYARLKEFTDFSPNFETFESLFWQQLDKDKSDVAIALLLRVVYRLLSSDGERFNELLELVDADKAQELRVWLEDARSRHDR